MEPTALAISTAARGDYALARKALDHAEQQGAAAVALLEAAAEVGASARRGAVSPVPGASETGRRLDIEG